MASIFLMLGEERDSEVGLYRSGSLWSLLEDSALYLMELSADSETKRHRFGL